MPVPEPAPSRSTLPVFPDGLVLAPFRALRYDQTHTDLAQVTSPPYDVIDAAGAAALEQASDVNVVRLILPRDEHSEGDRYARASRTLGEWRATGVLRADDRAALYVYEQASDGHAQRGLLGALALSPPEDGIVLPHENTMSGIVSDRLALYTAVEADLEPIFLVYGGGGAASEAVAHADEDPPVVDVVLADGLRHRLWPITDPTLLKAIADDLHGRTALIADGHHRYATYLQRQAASWDAGHGAGPWDSGLTFLVDSSSFGPEVHAIHRVLPDQDAVDLASRVSALATVHELDGQDLDGALAALCAAGEDGPAFLLVSGDGGTLRLITEIDAERRDAAMPPERSAAWRSLDVSLLHHLLVTRVWDIPDDEQHVQYAHDPIEAVARAAASAGTAILLNPTPAQVVAEVAAAGERMPRKSTLFTPKPRSGLVIRTYADA